MGRRARAYPSPPWWRAGVPLEVDDLGEIPDDHDLGRRPLITDAEHEPLIEAMWDEYQQQQEERR